MKEDQHEHNEGAQNRYWKKLREGDEQAMGIIFSSHYRMLYHYGYRIVKDRELVKDSIQELFYRLWNSRDRLPRVQSVRAYLLVSLRRELLSKKKAGTRRETMNESYRLEQFANFINYEKWLEILDLDRQRKEELKKAIEELSPRQREAVYLKYYEGLSTSEMCYVMDLQAQSIYNILAKSIKSLRLFLDN